MKKIIFHDFFYEQESRNILPFVFISLFLHGLLIAAVLGGILPVFGGGDGNHESGIPDINLVSETRGQSNRNQQVLHPDRGETADLRRRSIRKRRDLEPGLEEKSSLQGRILNKASIPVAGANVAVINLKTRQTMTTISDSSGIYSLHQLEPGEYEIRIRTVQLDQPLRRSVTIGRGMRLTLNIHEPNPGGGTFVAAGGGNDGSEPGKRGMPVQRKVTQTGSETRPESSGRIPSESRGAETVPFNRSEKQAAQIGDSVTGSIFRSLSTWSFRSTDNPPAVTDIILDHATMILIRRFMTLYRALDDILRRCRSLAAVWD